MESESGCESPCTGPRWKPPCSLHKWKALFKRAMSFDLHLFISIPLSVIIFAFVVVEGCLYFLVRTAGRLVEKWSNPPDVRRLIQKLSSTECFDTYRRCAEQLDKLTGRDRWKHSEEVDPNAPGYDTNLVRQKTNELRSFQQDGNISALVQCVRTCLDSQLLNTLNPVLYSMTYAGTKVLSEDLQEEVVQAIEYLTNFISRNPTIALTDPDLFVAIKRLPKRFGTTALFLSGGAMLGLHHFGLLESLVQNNLLPKVSVFMVLCFRFLWFCVFAFLSVFIFWFQLCKPPHP